MKKATSLITPWALLACSGCFGTPHLLEKAPPDSLRASPSIDDVKQEINCELIKYRNDQAFQHAELPAFQQPYLVTATLTLQIDDYLDFTPSFSIIHALPVMGDMRTITASADIGGQRERTYTEIFYLDTGKLDKFPNTDAYNAWMKTYCNPERYFRGNKYSLRGDLKLDEIIENGEKSLKLTDPYKAAVTTNTNPSFGSTIEFIVTQSLTALGPQWTMKRFKGPSGDKGIVNGKKVKTDKLVISFATPLPPAKPAPQIDSAKIADALEAVARAVAKASTASQQSSTKYAASVQANAHLNSLEQRYQYLLSAKIRVKPSQELLTARIKAAEGRASAFQADREAAAAELAVKQARADFEKAYTQSSAPPAGPTGVESAAGANLILQQTMILQGLNAQPH